MYYLPLPLPLSLSLCSSSFFGLSVLPHFSDLLIIIQFVLPLMCNLIQVLITSGCRGLKLGPLNVTSTKPHSVFYTAYARIQRGGGGRGYGPHENIGFLSNTYPVPLEITNLQSQHSIWATIKMAFRRRVDDGPLIVVFGSTLPSSTRKTLSESSPSGELSGSAHSLSFIEHTSIPFRLLIVCGKSGTIRGSNQASVVH